MVAHHASGTGGCSQRAGSDRSPEWVGTTSVARRPERRRAGPAPPRGPRPPPSRARRVSCGRAVSIRADAERGQVARQCRHRPGSAWSLVDPSTGPGYATLGPGPRSSSRSHLRRTPLVRWPHVLRHRHVGVRHRRRRGRGAAVLGGAPSLAGPERPVRTAVRHPDRPRGAALGEPRPVRDRALRPRPVLPVLHGRLRDRLRQAVRPPAQPGHHRMAGVARTGPRRRASSCCISGFVVSSLLVGLSLTTTALGTLLPMLRDRDMLESPFGKFLVAAGTAGEFGPVVAVTVLLGASSPETELILLVAVRGPGRRDAPTSHPAPSRRAWSRRCSAISGPPPSCRCGSSCCSSPGSCCWPRRSASRCCSAPSPPA